MSIKWSREFNTKQMNIDEEIKEGDSLVEFKEQVASLPDIVPIDMIGSIQVHIEEKTIKK